MKKYIKLKFRQICELCVNPGNLPLAADPRRPHSGGGLSMTSDGQGLNCLISVICLSLEDREISDKTAFPRASN